MEARASPASFTHDEHWHGVCEPRLPSSLVKKDHTKDDILAQHKSRMTHTFPLPAQTSHIIQLTHHQEAMERCAAEGHSLVAMDRWFENWDGQWCSMRIQRR
jgi:hypothetical protein